MLTRLACLFMVLVSLPTPNSWACTVFCAIQGDTVLVGNNEDYFNPATKIWFHPAKETEYGRVYFGWDNEYNIPMGGMNDQGLFFDFLAVPAFVVGDDPEKDPLPMVSAFVHAMSKTCRTVQQALDLWAGVNTTGRWEAILIVADGAGDCALIDRPALRTGPCRWRPLQGRPTRDAERIRVPQRPTGPGVDVVD
jgi:hypothetical protein